MASPIRSARLRSIIFDVLIALGVATFGAVNFFQPYALILGCVMGAGLLVRRRLPLTSMGIVAAAALAQVIAARYLRNDLLPQDVAVLIAMYSVVKYTKRMSRAYAAAGVVAVGIVIEVVRQRNAAWWAFAVFLAATCAGVWATAYTLRTRRAYVAGLEERAATLEREREALTRIAIAEERASIAREMHDVVAHSLAVIIVQADGGRYAMAADPEAGRRTLETVAATGREAFDEMRRLIDLLRGGHDHGTAVADDADRLVVGRDRLYALVERARSAGLTVVVDSSGLNTAVTTSADLAAYRIVREALTNVLRHAGAQATVSISAHRAADTFRITVVDDGGAEASRPAGTDRIGHGIVGMRERVAVHGGTFDAGRHGGGFRVHAVIPAPVPAGAPELASAPA